MILIEQRKHRMLNG